MKTQIFAFGLLMKRLFCLTWYTLLSVFVVMPLYAQTLENDETTLENLGVNPVHSLILPGLVDRELGPNDTVFPFYQRILLDDQNLELNFAPLLEDPLVLNAPAVESEVTVVAAEIVDGKIYSSSTLASDIYVYSSAVPIASLRVNGEELPIVPGLLVQALSNVRLKPGENKITVSGELVDTTPYERTYSVFTQKPARNFNIIATLAYGYDSNPTGALDQSLEDTELLEDVYALEEDPDTYVGASLVYAQRLDDAGTRFNIGALLRQYNKEDENLASYQVLFGSFNYELEALSPYARIAYYMSEEKDYTNLLAGLAFNFFYVPGSKPYERAYDRLLLDGFVGRNVEETVQTNFYDLGVVYEANTWKDFFSVANAELHFGAKGLGEEAEELSYINGSVFAQWDYTRLSYNTGAKYEQQQYTNCTIINQEPCKKKNRIWVGFIGGSYQIYNALFSTALLEYTQARSNYFPHKKLLAELGLKYIY